MRKLLIVLLVLMIATPVFAKEYRLKADFLILNENHAIALYNLIENNKDKIYLPTEPFENGKYEIYAEACFIDSWDTENPPKPGFTRHCITFDGPSEVWEAVDTDIAKLQAVVDEWQAKIDAQQAKIDAKNAALQIKKDELQALIDAQ